MIRRLSVVSKMFAFLICSIFGAECLTCVCKISQFRLYLAMITSIFKFRPLLRFLCPINSFYRRNVSSMYNGSDRPSRLTNFDRLNLAQEQRLQNQLFHQNNLTVAKDWFSQSGLDGGAYVLTAFNNHCFTKY